MDKLQNVAILQLTTVATIFWFVLVMFGIVMTILPNTAGVGVGYFTALILTTIITIILHRKSKGISND